MLDQVQRQLQRSPIAMVALLATVAGAGAATAHRYDVSTGDGSEGAFSYNNTSASGGALQGPVSSGPVTGIRIPFGVLGDYTDTGTFGIGVAGVSVSGYGVGAEAFGGAPALITLQYGTTDAADIYNKGSGYGLYASSTDNVGLYGSTSADPTQLQESSVAGVASATGGGQGYLGENTGEGVYAIGNSGSSNHPAALFASVNAGTDVLQASAGGLENFVVQGQSANRSGMVGTADASDAQLYGDLYVVGRIYQECYNGDFPEGTGDSCSDVSSSSTPSTTGVARQTYAAKQSVPTVEDFGYGHLSAGSAYVRLDPTFAQTMAQNAPYHVFITPNGESRGLYVTQKTAGGFVVRENAQGRSTLDFDYRIVATPLGDRSQRLPAIARHAGAGHHRTAMPKPPARRSASAFHDIAGSRAAPFSR